MGSTIKNYAVTTLGLVIFSLSNHANSIGPNDAYIFCDEKSKNCVAIEKEGQCDFEYPGCTNVTYYSTDGMRTWQQGAMNAHFLHTYHFSGLACQKNLNYCIAAGTQTNQQPQVYNNVAMLVSHDKGLTWTSPTIPFTTTMCTDTSLGGRGFDSIRCDENGHCQAKGWCIGFDRTRGTIEVKELISSTQDSGQTWRSDLSESKADEQFSRKNR